MKKRFPVIIIILLFIIGLGVMLYPFIANMVNNLNQAEIIENYNNTVAEMEEEALKSEKEAAREYNESLLDNVVLTDPFDENANKKASEEYKDRLNVNGDDVMGYIEVPKIDVKLSIFHGTSTEILNKAAGHLENTSLPVGGTGTHAVISAHTGYPNAKFFDRLNEMKEGDVFYLTVLNERLAYQVDQIKVVTPKNTNDLNIDRAEDFVTLITCTPYGVNSHRLLVRGTRIPYVEENYAVDSVAVDYWYLPYAVVAVIVLLIIIILVFVLKRRRRLGDRR